MTSYTIKRRARTDEYGSGRELELVATATRLDAEELAEHELDPAAPWAIILSGSEITYGPGSAVLNWNTSQWDPNGEWRHSMRAEEPTEADCRAEAESLMHTYVSEHSDENWGATRMTATMELHELTASARDTAELIEWNRALRDHLLHHNPQGPATTEINGGDLVTIVDEDDRPRTVAQVLAEIDEFLDYDEAE